MIRHTMIPRRCVWLVDDNPRPNREGAGRSVQIAANAADPWRLRDKIERLSNAAEDRFRAIHAAVAGDPIEEFIKIALGVER